MYNDINNKFMDFSDKRMLEGNFIPQNDTNLPKKRQNISSESDIVYNSDDASQLGHKRVKTDVIELSDVNSNSNSNSNDDDAALIQSHIINSESDEEPILLKKKAEVFKYVHPEDLARRKKVIRRPKEITKGSLKGFLPAVHAKKEDDDVKLVQSLQLGKVEVIDDELTFKRQNYKSSIFRVRKDDIVPEQDRVLGIVPNFKPLERERIPHKKLFTKNSFSFLDLPIKKKNRHKSFTLEYGDDASTIDSDYNDTVVRKVRIKKNVQKSPKGLVYGCYSKQYSIRLVSEQLLYFYKCSYPVYNIVPHLSSIVNSEIKINALKVFGYPNEQIDENRDNYIYFLYLNHDIPFLERSERFQIMESIFKCCKSYGNIPSELLGCIIAQIIHLDHISSNDIRDILRSHFSVECLPILINTAIKNDTMGEEYLILLFDSCTTFIDKKDMNEQFLKYWLKLCQFVQPLRYRCIWSLYTKLTSLTVLSDDTRKLFMSILELMPEHILNTFLQQTINKCKNSNPTNDQIDLLYHLMYFEPSFIPYLYSFSYKNYYLAFQLFCKLGYSNKELDDCLSHLDGQYTLSIVTNTLTIRNRVYMALVLSKIYKKLTNLSLKSYFAAINKCPVQTEWPEKSLVLSLLSSTHIYKLECLVQLQKNSESVITTQYISTFLKVLFDFTTLVDVQLFGQLYSSTDIGILILQKFNLTPATLKLRIKEYSIKDINECSLKSIFSHLNKRDMRLFYAKYREYLSDSFLSSMDDNTYDIVINTIDYTSNRSILVSIASASIYMHKDQRYLLFSLFYENPICLEYVLTSYINLPGDIQELQFYIHLLLHYNIYDHKVWYLIFKIIMSADYFEYVETIQSPFEHLVHKLEHEMLPGCDLESITTINLELFVTLSFSENWKIKMTRHLLNCINWTINTGYFK